MQNFLSHVETEFYDLTGVLPEGIIGLFGGLLLFSLIIYLIRFEKKKEISHFLEGHLVVQHHLIAT